MNDRSTASAPESSMIAAAQTIADAVRKVRKSRGSNMKPASAKQKGRLAQQEICRSILEAFPELEPDDVVSTSMGAPGEDIRLSPKARSILPFCIEAKNQERLNIHSALEQAKSHAIRKNLIPLLVFRRNRTEFHVTLDWQYFLTLLQELHDARTDS